MLHRKRIVGLWHFIRTSSSYLCTAFWNPPVTPPITSTPAMNRARWINLAKMVILPTQGGNDHGESTPGAWADIGHHLPSCCWSDGTLLPIIIVASPGATSIFESLDTFFASCAAPSLPLGSSLFVYNLQTKLQVNAAQLVENWLGSSHHYPEVVAKCFIRYSHKVLSQKVGTALEQRYFCFHGYLSR